MERNLQLPEYCTPKQVSPADFGSISIVMGVVQISFTYLVLAYDADMVLFKYVCSHLLNCSFGRSIVSEAVV